TVATNNKNSPSPRLPVNFFEPLPRVDGAGLWALVTVFFCIFDFVANMQFVESVVQDAVLVEINLAPIACLEKAVALVGEQLFHARAADAVVAFDLATNLAGVFVQHALRVVERVFDGRVGVLMGCLLRWVATDDQLPVGNADVDAYVVVPAMMMMPV